MTEQHPDPETHWKHRRRLAYMSFACLAALLLGMLTNSIPKELLPLAQTLAWVFSANILYYYGNNAAEAWGAARK